MSNQHEREIISRQLSYWDKYYDYLLSEYDVLCLSLIKPIDGFYSYETRRDTIKKLVWEKTTKIPFTVR